MEKYFRINFINSLSGFKSASLIGTKSKDGYTNLAIFNSVIHVGAKPPAMGFLMRPTTIERNTYSNIKDTGYFTINHISKHIINQAHQTSAKYNKSVSEFDACGFTPEYTNNFFAPYVNESLIKIGLKFVEEERIMYNDTIFVVGEVVDIILPDNIIAQDGFCNIEAAGTIAITGLDSYHFTEQITRLPYAKT